MKKRESISKYGATLLPVEGGRYYLKLLKQIKLKPDTSRDTEGESDNKNDANKAPRRVSVVDWDIVCKYSDLERELVRKFKLLYTKAIRRDLSDKEQNLYHRISHYVDVQNFEENNAIEIRAIATLISIKPECIVEWRGGHREVLAPQLGERLPEINIGETFSCRIKRQDEKTAEIRNVFPIT